APASGDHFQGPPPRPDRLPRRPPPRPGQGARGPHAPPARDGRAPPRRRPPRPLRAPRRQAPGQVLRPALRAPQAGPSPLALRTLGLKSAPFGSGVILRAPVCPTPH